MISRESSVCQKQTNVVYIKCISFCTGPSVTIAETTAGASVYKINAYDPDANSLQVSLEKQIVSALN